MKFIQTLKLIALILAFVPAVASHAKALALNEAQMYFDKPYLQFAKEWMKESGVEKGFGIFGAIIGMNSLNLDAQNEIKRTFEYPGANAVTRAVEIFTAYCTSNQGKIDAMKNEVYCIKSNTVQAFMGYFMITEPHEKAVFVHRDGQLAQARYNYLTNISPGDSIKTRYGQGLVIEVKENHLINFQPNNGQARWITTADVN